MWRILERNYDMNENQQKRAELVQRCAQAIQSGQIDMARKYQSEMLALKTDAERSLAGQHLELERVRGAK